MSTLTKLTRWPGIGGGLLAVIVVGALSAGCVNVQAGDGGFVMGSNIVVEEDEVAREDLVAVGGSIRVDGVARREVVVIGGELTVNGRVERDVTVVGGRLRLGPGARVGGNATVVGGSLSRDPTADVDGETVNVSFGPGLDSMFGGYSPFHWGGWWGFAPFAMFARLTQLLYWLLLGVLTVALVGDRVSSASHAVSREPLRLGAIGLVGFIALSFAFLVLLILSFLLIGIPFLLALIFGWWLAYIFGIVAVFQTVGSRVMRIAGRPEASQIGIVLAGGLVIGILRFFPLFGTLMWWICALVGLGAVFATRFGTNRPWLRQRISTVPTAATTSGPRVDIEEEETSASPAEEEVDSAPLQEDDYQAPSDQASEEDEEDKGY